MIDSKGQGQWSYARSDRFTGWPARSLCQMAAVRARMRCRTRITTPAGVLPPCRSRSIWLRPGRNAKVVRWGEASEMEMMDGWIEYVDAPPGGTGQPQMHADLR